MSKLLAGAMALIMLAGFQSTVSHAEDGKLVIGASEVRERIREYSDGRKLRYCYVVFTLTNKTGKALRRARFWVEAANGKRESFGLRDGKTRNSERFENTPCSDVRGKLKLRRAVCQWGADKNRADCAAQVTLDVK